MLPCQAACADFWGHSCTLVEELGISLFLQACLGWQEVLRAVKGCPARRTVSLQFAIPTARKNCVRESENDSAA